MTRPATAAPTRAAMASKTRALGSLSLNPSNTCAGCVPVGVPVEEHGRVTETAAELLHAAGVRPLM